MTTQPATATDPAPGLPPVLKTGLNPNGASPNGDGPNGSPRPDRPKRPGPPRASRLKAVLIAAALALVAAGGVTGYVLSQGPKGPRPDLILHKVRYEPVQLTVVERGALESADNREVTCRVK